jgi:hypothetical protein
VPTPSNFQALTPFLALTTAGGEVVGDGDGEPGGGEATAPEEELDGAVPGVRRTDVGAVGTGAATKGFLGELLAGSMMTTATATAEAAPRTAPNGFTMLCRTDSPTEE